MSELSRLMENVTRRSRARDRLNAHPSGRYLHFAIVGLDTEDHAVQLCDDLAHLHPIGEAPHESDLLLALQESHRPYVSALRRYAPVLTHELSLNCGDELTNDDALKGARFLLGSLRLRTGAEILIPFCSNVPWSCIAGAPEGSCTPIMLEDIPMAHAFRPESRVRVTREHFDWVNSTYFKLVAMLTTTDQRFMLAFSALTTYHHQANSRMSAAQLWSGIEALLGADSETTFRLSAYIATVLEERGPRRAALFRSTKALYGVRSKIVHGSQIKREKVNAHVSEARELLVRLMLTFLHNGKVPSRNDLDEALFS